MLFEFLEKTCLRGLPTRDLGEFPVIRAGELIAFEGLIGEIVEAKDIGEM